MLSFERISDELTKILTGPNPAEALRDLRSIGFIQRVIPELSSLWSDFGQQSPLHHAEGDVWEHTLALFGNDGGLSLDLALAILLHDCGKPRTFRIREVHGNPQITNYGHDTVGAVIAQKILSRLRFSLDITQKVCFLVANHMKVFQAAKFNKSTLRKLLANEHFPLLLELHRRDIAGSIGQHEDDHAQKFASFLFLQEAFARHQENPLPEKLLNGRDLLDMGLQRGPLFKEILDALWNAQLEGAVQNRKEAISFVNDFVGSVGQATPQDTQQDTQQVN